MTRVLVVDDEPGVRAALVQLLEYEGVETRAVASAAEAFVAYEEFHPAVTFLDVKMAGMDGLSALKVLRQRDPAAVVVMISGHATIRDAIEATQLGAFDILEKPLDTDRILVTLRNALGTQELRAENARLKARVVGRSTMVGTSHALTALRQQVAQVAPTPARVLITGENGTGKELVARALHEGSPRAKKPFIELNCAAIPSELIESELFGHVKGSFTGAVADRSGKFEQADGGTLFLDEIGDMALAAQAKVLRVLQEGELTRIGGTKRSKVDVRVVAATNKRLDEEIAAGRFREDLYYRLNVVPLHVPPLRERREDIPALIEHFVALLTQHEGVAPRRFDAEAVALLARRDWPGNIRELRNTVERLLILSTGAVVTSQDVERLVGARAVGASGDIGVFAECQTFEEFKDVAERAFLVAKLRAHDWNVAETARVLEMPRSNLYKKIERFALTREDT
jgi:two-component system, NtrC family, nitrogen regulation response regulator NtrX